tara:strand:+ start:309 stop:512 length:204 start_codon:yes stop_codon:yes gene_type:complete
MNDYYVAWIPPNKDFEEKFCKGTECDSLPVAQGRANQLNHETKGSLGHYAPRKFSVYPRGAAPWEAK